MKITVGVIGKNEQHPNDHVDARTMAAAETIGRLVAERGGVIVTGGRAGVMEAASRGAQRAGGLTIGFLPGMEKSGSTGTLNELTIAYAEARPVVILAGSGGWSDRIRGVLHKGCYLDERETVEIHFADTPEQAVATAFELATGPTPAGTPDRP